ncbi:MAG: MarR family transcriptional regulator [Prosthecochloris sp.]|nr:MarR family transcriptional regulator [Prosthecochloris sp.]
MFFCVGFFVFLLVHLFALSNIYRSIVMDSQAYTVKGLLGHELGVTSGVLRKVFASRIREHAKGISPEQLAVLVRLSSGEGFHQNEIAEYVLKDDATITRILDSLEEKGLAGRKRSVEDRRSNIAFITPEGRSLVERVFPLIVDLHKELVSGIDPLDVARVVTILGLVRNNALGLN